LHATSEASNCQLKKEAIGKPISWATWCDDRELELKVSLGSHLARVYQGMQEQLGEIISLLVDRSLIE
jgi:hypothetical protein